ncbi:hypothetical protein BC826DRAFT_1093741 [Russula brevipes]|nr:hypothetical protein BC826DRAFT_1093741 [Russula brevipes]
MQRSIYRGRLARVEVVRLANNMGSNFIRPVCGWPLLHLNFSSPSSLAPARSLTTENRPTPCPDIHSYRTSRTFVLCFDGTGDQFDADNTNVVQFCSALKKDDGNQQMVYYQPGVGTYSIPQIVTPFKARVQKYVNMAIANHLNAHVMSGYKFLMEHYRARDRICIFGFSRGAYTARALAGMIQKVGLLPPGNHQQVPFAYKMDTVCSVGVVPHTLPLTDSNSAVRYFRHAVALDECRAAYQVNHWHQGNPHDYKGVADERTNVREVWFAGCHSDVGGGSVLNGTRNSLARISLRWMIHECFRTKSGIQFRRDSLEALGICLGTHRHSSQGKASQQSSDTGDIVAPVDANVINDTPTSPEATTFTNGEEEDRADALSPMHDQLEMVKAWWILEWLPLRHRRQYEGNGSPRHYWSCYEPTQAYFRLRVNLGRPRELLWRTRAGEKILVHRSVKTRMDLGSEGGKYAPKAKFDHQDAEWVD